MFLTSGLFPDILYAFNSILASVITGMFLYDSILKIAHIRKAVYVSCGSISLVFILPVAVCGGFIHPVYALPPGMLVVSFLWGVFRYERLWRQNRARLICILALMLMSVQIVLTLMPVFLPELLSFLFHYELEISGLPIPIILFYLSLSLGIPLLFASYLPRRDILRWTDRAAVVVSAAAFAAVVCGLVLSFQDRLADGLLVALDLTVCLLTAAAYVLLLLAGKKTAHDPSESLPETKTERDSAG